MSKEITKARILQEIQDKFKLRELLPATFTFDETVVPTYDIGQHLLSPTVVSKTVSVSTIGAITVHTVPAGEKWHLHTYNVIFMTGAFTIAGVMIYRPLAVDWIYLDMSAAMSVSYANDLPKDVLLFPGEDLAINVDGYTSTGDIQLRLSVTKEEIR